MELIDFRVLHEGATSTVYQAFDQQFGRHVALRVVPHWPGNVAEDLTRIRRIVGRLSQRTQISLIFDAAPMPDGGAYIVSELPEGGTVGQYIAARARVDNDRVTTIAWNLGQAIASAHAEGIVHGALSPEELHFDGDGHLKIADFGVGSILQAGNAHNEHAAPELLVGDEATPAADVYALGSILYTLLEGRSPYRRTRRDLPRTVNNRKQEGQQPPRPLHGTPALIDLIMSCIDLRPEARPTAFSILQDLKPLLVSPTIDIAGRRQALVDGPVVGIPYFDDQARSADRAAAAQVIKDLQTSSVRQVSQAKLDRQRRNKRRLGVAGVAAAVLLIAGIGVLVSGGKERVVTGDNGDGSTTTSLRASLGPALSPTTGPAVTTTQVSTSTSSSTSTTVPFVFGPTTTVAFVFGPTTTVKPSLQPGLRTTSTTTTAPTRLLPPTTDRVGSTTPAPATTIPAPAAVIPVAITTTTTTTQPAPPPPTLPPAPVVVAPHVGPIGATVLSNGNASFTAPQADRCAESLWQVSGPVSFSQQNGWNSPPGGCWTASHQFDTAWGSYPTLTSGAYTVRLTLRSDGVTASNSTSFVVP